MTRFFPIRFIFIIYISFYTLPQMENPSWPSSYFYTTISYVNILSTHNLHQNGWIPTWSMSKWSKWLMFDDLLLSLLHCWKGGWISRQELLHSWLSLNDSINSMLQRVHKRSHSWEIWNRWFIAWWCVGSLLLYVVCYGSRRAGSYCEEWYAPWCHLYVSWIEADKDL